jgi:hypothetical protein
MVSEEQIISIFRYKERSIIPPSSTVNTETASPSLEITFKTAKCHNSEEYKSLPPWKAQFLYRANKVVLEEFAVIHSTKEFTVAKQLRDGHSSAMVPNPESAEFNSLIYNLFI